MIIHFVNDEKFIDGFIEDQRKYCSDTENVYFAWSKGAKELKHIKNKEVRLKDDDSFEESMHFIREKQPSKIIFHNLNRRNWRIILNIPSNITICWIFYGSEIFNRPENLHLFTSPLTSKLLNQSYRMKMRNYFLRILLRIERLFHKAFNVHYSEFYKVISRVDFFAHWIEEDYKFVKTRYHLKNLKFIEFCYANKAFELENSGIKENLLIGNSGSDTNNHLDVISMLQEAFITKFNKVIIPLSYGGQPAYVAKVKKIAEEKFGKKVFIMDSFIDRQGYFSILSSVKLAIMGHYRSQAGGNIRFFLKNGIDVMMPETNNMYKFLSRAGIKIHPLESLSDKLAFLSIHEHKKNKEAQLAIFEGDMVNNYYQNLLTKT